MKTLIEKFKSFLRRVILFIETRVVLLRCRIMGPPRVLMYSSQLNIKILRLFGARVGQNKVRIHAPLTLHAAEGGYTNLSIEDGCFLGGNNFLDLSARITLEGGVSLAPGVIIMTHNTYNYNDFLIESLSHTCGKKEVMIKEGAGIKAGALITMGVTIGKNVVVGGKSVVNRDVSDNCFVAGTPAKLVKTIE